MELSTELTLFYNVKVFLRYTVKSGDGILAAATAHSTRVIGTSRAIELKGLCRLDGEPLGLGCDVGMRNLNAVQAVFHQLPDIVRFVVGVCQHGNTAGATNGAL